MELTTSQITYIKHDLHKRGIAIQDLADSLLDHICCVLEDSPETDFHQAYNKAVEAFGEEGIQKVQEETLLLLILKKDLTMKKTMFVLGYIAVFLSTTGLLFKLQHWPGAAVMLTLGIALLNFGFLPMYFYGRYKKASAT